MLRKWEQLPDFMKTEAVRPYYDILSKKKKTLMVKRVFDIVMAASLLILLSPVMLVIAIAVKLDSKGEVFFRQERVTQYGKIFKIYKFRTMVKDADKLGSQVTTKNDARVTRIGRFLRKYRLDETSQLFNVLSGDMSFVGPRPCQPRGIEDDLIDARLSYIPSPVLVRPGLSGYAQIYLHRDNDCKKKAEYDAYYVAHLGLWLDIKIFFWSFLCLFGYTPGR